MSVRIGVERAAALTAAACTEALGAVTGREVSCSPPVVSGHPTGAWTGLEYPLVTTLTTFTGGEGGDALFVLRPAQARALGSLFTGVGEPPGRGDLSEAELSAVAEALARTADAMAGALTRELGRSITSTPSLPVLAATAEEIAAPFAGASFSASFTLRAGGVSSDIVQVVSVELAELLAAAPGEGDAVHATPDGRPGTAGTAGDGARSAVERAARVTADAAADVVYPLMGEAASARPEDVDADADDPFGTLTHPLILVEASYVSGLEGTTLFALAAGQAATLAAVLLGADEPLGDGRSELELSAVSEALGQMARAATTALSDALGMGIAIAPPTCRVVEDAEEARRTFGRAAFRTGLRLVSDRVRADIVQLLPADLAEQLAHAFAAADHRRAARGADTPPPATPEPDPPPPRSPADRPGTPAGTVDPDSVRAVRVRLSAELGRALLPIARVTNLPPGAVVELDRGPHDPVDLLVNGRPFASAKLVVVDGEYAVQIVSLTPPRVAP